MNWPQITWIVLAALTCGVALARHGQLKTGFDARYSFPATLFGTALAAVLLWCGGFFGGGA